MKGIVYLGNLFHIYHIFGIVSIRANNLCTSRYLQMEKEYLLVQNMHNALTIKQVSRLAPKYAMTRNLEGNA
jgi:hypothetical protein